MNCCFFAFQLLAVIIVDAVWQYGVEIMLSGHFKVKTQDAKQPLTHFQCVVV